MLDPDASAPPPPRRTTPVIFSLLPEVSTRVVSPEGGLIWPIWPGLVVSLCDGCVVSLFDGWVVSPAGGRVGSVSRTGMVSCLRAVVSWANEIQCSNRAKVNSNPPRNSMAIERAGVFTIKQPSVLKLSNGTHRDPGSQKRS